MKSKAKLEIKREVKTYWDLNVASYAMLEKAKETKDGGYYTIMAGLIFSAFCFEAYLNHLGNEKIKFWEEIEKIKLFDKYKVLCKEFGIVPNYGIRPYQTLNKLFKFRNALAHGKSRILKVEEVVNIDEDIWDYEPKVGWEEYCTLVNANRAREDMQAIITELNVAAGEGEFAFYSGMTFGRKSLQ